MIMLVLPVDQCKIDINQTQLLSLTLISFIVLYNTNVTAILVSIRIFSVAQPVVREGCPGGPRAAVKNTTNIKDQMETQRKQ